MADVVNLRIIKVEGGYQGILTVKGKPPLESMVQKSLPVLLLDTGELLMKTVETLMVLKTAQEIVGMEAAKEEVNGIIKRLHDN